MYEHLEEKSTNSKTVRVLKLVADDVAATFPYFFGFYLISLCVSIFFPAWRDYFNWPAFHLSVIFLALISLCSDTVQDFLREIKGASGIAKGKFLFKKFFTAISSIIIVPVGKRFLLWQRSLGRSDYYKIAAMVLILGFSLFQDIYVVDFFILFFGLISVLFGVDMRISAGCALVLLALCPFLLAFNESVFAESAAVYAYYFLVIAVLTGIGDHIRGKELSTVK